MKALVLGLALIASPVMGEEAKKEELCPMIGELAQYIMEARQLNVSMSKSMELAAGEDWIEDIVIKAYEYPAYQSAEVQRKTIDDFANHYLLSCYKSFQEKNK